MKQVLLVILIICLSQNGLKAAEKETLWFPQKKRVPFLFADPTEKFASISGGALSKNTVLDYPYYAPLCFAITKTILSTRKYDFSVEAGVHYQFGYRYEDTNFMHGWRKTNLNEDFRIDFNYSRTLGDKWLGVISVMHRSTHLGDDYILLQGIKPANYWKSDPSNYEEVSVTLFYKNKFFNGYVKPGYVIRLDTPRKRIELQGGFFVTELKPKGLLNRFIGGCDVRVLEETGFNPGVSVKTGLRIAPRFHCALMYYQGPLPYSRFESVLNIRWAGIGFFFEPVI